LIRVGDDDFVERLQTYVDLAPAIRERVPRMDYVDLRFGERVYVRPQGTRDRSLPTVGD
jgi:cell division septal protein FtsQ